MKIFNFIKRTKPNKKAELLVKFDKIEKEEILEKESLLQSNKKPPPTEENKVPTFFEEEVFWWEDSQKDNELLNEEISSEDPGRLLSIIKKTELFHEVQSGVNLSIEYCDDNQGNRFIKLLWDSPYMNLSERRNYLNLINEFVKEVERYDSKCALVHDHRRLSISNKLGVKITILNEKSTTSNKSLGEANP